MTDYVEGHYDYPLTKPSEHKPLKGVRVIDAGNMVAAPFTAVLLADFGADIIKIEHPSKGDPLRNLDPFKEGVPLWWKAISRNKRCVTLDLSKPEGAEIFKDLIRDRDVLVENYRPGTLDRWGLGYDVLSSERPGLVMLRISGFGQTGPYRDRPGFGRVAEAISGLTHLIGEPDGPPMSPGYPLGDLISGIFGAFSVMMALYHRDQHGGPGQVIDLALHEAVFRLLDFDAIQYDQLHMVHNRTGNQTAYVAPSSTFVTADGKYVTIAASTPNIWERLCVAIGRAELPADPRFKTNALRLERREEINGIVGDWMARHTRDFVVGHFDEHKVAYSPIFDISDIFKNAQFLAREAMVRVPDEELGEAIVQGVVPKLSATPGAVDFLGPARGAHNEAVYGDELGYSAHKIKSLSEAGVI